MARDYKRAVNNKKNPKNTAPGWLLFVAGLAIGLFCTLLVYLQMQSSRSLFGEKFGEKFERESKQETQVQVIDIDSDKQVATQKTTQATKKKDEKPATARPRFDFYTILPELEVLIPDEEIKRKRTKPEETSVRENGSLAKNSAAKDAYEKDGGAFVLQAGSFKSFDLADRRKARLALLGAFANIQRVTIHDNEVWYRVRIGPFNNLKKLDNIRVLLHKNNINAIPLKVKPEKK